MEAVSICAPRSGPSRTGRCSRHATPSPTPMRQTREHGALGPPGVVLAVLIEPVSVPDVTHEVVDRPEPVIGTARFAAQRGVSPVPVAGRGGHLQHPCRPYGADQLTVARVRLGARGEYHLHPSTPPGERREHAIRLTLELGVGRRHQGVAGTTLHGPEGRRHPAGPRRIHPRSHAGAGEYTPLADGARRVSCERKQIHAPTPGSRGAEHPGLVSVAKPGELGDRPDQGSR